jgi:nucleotide-binding universal stress UspA family protein
MAEIIVGVDGSEPAAAALRWAARESAWRGEPLVAALAWGFLNQHHAAQGADFDPEYTEADALEALGSYVAGALGEGSAAELRPINDLPWRALVGAATGASMLVVGARGLGGFKSLLLGSVSHQCLHHATCPVAVVRGVVDHPPAGDHRIVVGIDGSATARAALRWAVDEAEHRGARVDVVHAWQLPFTGPYPYMEPASDPTRCEDEAQAVLDAAVDGLRTTVKTEKLLAPGGATSVILDAAEGADLIVVGARGVGGFERLVLGSTSMQVVHHAPCPVVVLPAVPEPR